MTRSTHEHNATNSDSNVDLATDPCFLDPHEIREPLTFMMYPDTDFLVSESVPKFASLQASTLTYSFLL